MLIRYEEGVICDTRGTFGDRDWRWPVAVDEVLRLVHFEGQVEPVSSHAGAFQYRAQIWYAQAPYTVLSVWRLWRTGYYLEAVTLLRHLYEVLVQLRYFHVHADRLEPHLDAKPRDPAHVSFRKMFEETCPGVYDVLYRFLSNSAHGAGTILFRAQVNADQRTVQRLTGTQFDYALADTCLALLSAAVLGLLNWFFVFFPSNTIAAADPVLAADLRDSREWLNALIEQARAAGRDFYDKLKPLLESPA